MMFILLAWTALVLLSLTKAPTNAKSSFAISKSTIRSINTLRGGALPNPSYQQAAPTLAEVDNDGRIYHTGATFQSPLQSRPEPLIQVIHNYLTELNKFSPSLFNGLAASLILFFMWQLPTYYVTKILQNHFVCSHYNVWRKKRLYVLITSAFSHASFYHLAVNMYAYIMFGRSVKPVLKRNGVELWVFVLFAAIFGNLVFLAFDTKQQGSCIGLSGVTLAMLAFDSLVYPTKELRMIVSFIPITLPAYYLYIGLLGLSVAGILGIVGRGNVAHSTHLGGLVFGSFVFEAVKRGWIRLWSYRVRKTYQALTEGR